jgi:hypothetical protein
MTMSLQFYIFVNTYDNYLLTKTHIAQIRPDLCYVGFSNISLKLNNLNIYLILLSYIL